MSNPCKHPKVGRLGSFTTVTCPDCKKTWTPAEFKAFLKPGKPKDAPKPDAPVTDSKEDAPNE